LKGRWGGLTKLIASPLEVKKEEWEATKGLPKKKGGFRHEKTPDILDKMARLGGGL